MMSARNNKHAGKYKYIYKTFPSIFFIEKNEKKM